MGQYFKPYIRFMDGTEETYCSQNAIYMTKHGFSSSTEIDALKKSWDMKDPDSFGSCFSGIKLMEHSWMDCDFMNGIMERIEERPARIAWVGDYSDDLAGKIDCFTDDIYRKVWSDGDERLPELPFPALPKSHTDGYLVNHSRLIYMDLDKYYTENKTKDKNGWCVHPLSLLTAIGNGGGGGDYCSNIGIHDVGSWAMDIIEYTEEKDLAIQMYNEVLYRFDSNA